ncbi:MAG TPA: chloride channel protein, partial [Paludibacteraceae bacterium]|nr:chloride channel protein [Paludibacteraceae bacterium]
MEWNEIYIKLIAWREKHIKERQFILILSFLTGIFAALAAFLLKFAIHSIQSLITESFNRESLNYLYLITPAVGIIITSLFVRH